MIPKNRNRGLPVRLVAQGTRVILLRGTPPYPAGIISDVRTQPWLRTYVVACDDGTVVYVSPYDLAREDDHAVTPLGPRPEF